MKMNILLTNKVYNVLKWTCLVALPAVAVLLAALGEIWGIRNVEKIVLTVNACTVFFGALLGVSAAQYKKTDGNG